MQNTCCNKGRRISQYLITKETSLVDWQTLEQYSFLMQGTELVTLKTHDESRPNHQRYIHETNKERMRLIKCLNTKKSLTSNIQYSFTASLENDWVHYISRRMNHVKQTIPSSYSFQLYDVLRCKTFSAFRLNYVNLAIQSERDKLNFDSKAARVTHISP